MSQLKTYKLTGDISGHEPNVVLPEPRRGGVAEVIDLRRGQGDPGAGRRDGDQRVTLGTELINKLSTDENFRFLASRLKNFSEVTDARMKDLREALATEDWGAVASVAHVLTDYTGRMGAIRMMRLCIAMQMLGRRGMIEKAVGLMDELEAEYLQVKEGHLAALG